MADDEEDDRPFGYVCVGCQSTTDEDGRKHAVNKVRRTRTRGAAEALAKIHGIKTGHSPEVQKWG